MDLSVLKFPLDRQPPLSWTLSAQEKTVFWRLQVLAVKEFARVLYFVCKLCAVFPPQHVEGE
jgi:hypothetical protein